MGARITNSRTRATPLSSMLLPDAQKLADDPTKYGVAGLETFLGDV
jgi:chemotaxis receptor (MCP) glutamine deamidase CheD